MLGVVDETNDLLKRTLLNRTQHGHFDSAPKVDRSSQDRVPHRLFDGRRLTGEIGFVARGLALDDFGVDGELRAGFHRKAHAGSEVLHRHLGTWWKTSRQVATLGASRNRDRISFWVRPSAMFTRAPEKEKRKSKVAPLPVVGTHGRTARSHGEHEEVDIENPLDEAFPDFVDRVQGSPPHRRSHRGVRPGIRPMKYPARAKHPTPGRRPAGVSVGLVIAFSPGRPTVRGRSSGPWKVRHASRRAAGTGCPGDSGAIRFMADRETLLLLRRGGGTSRTILVPLPTHSAPLTPRSPTSGSATSDTVSSSASSARPRVATEMDFWGRLILTASSAGSLFMDSVTVRTRQSCAGIAASSGSPCPVFMLLMGAHCPRHRAAYRKRSGGIVPFAGLDR